MACAAVLAEDLDADGPLHRGDRLRQSTVGDSDRRRLVALPQSPARHHANLQRQQLVEGETLQRKVEGCLVRREVDDLDGRADRHPSAPNNRIQVVGILAPCIDRRPYGSPERSRPDALGQPIHRQQALGVTPIDGAFRFEIRVLQGRLPAIVDADLARNEDPGAGWPDTPLHELASEPDGIDDVAVLVGKAGDGPVEAARADGSSLQ